MPFHADGIPAPGRSRDSQPTHLHMAHAPIRSHFVSLPPGAHVTIVRTGGLGDTILALPTFEMLRLVCPGATFTLVGSAWGVALQPLVPFAVRASHIDRVFPRPRRHTDVADVFATSNAAIVYTATPESDFVDHVQHVCPGPVVVWPVAPAAGIHTARHLASAVVSAPTDLDALPLPTLRSPDEVRDRARERLDRHCGRGVRPLAIHPGSGGRRKCWPAHRFAEVATRLDAPVLLIEGPADADACREFSDALTSSTPVVRAAGESLSGLAALLMESRGYIGNDSGVSHLAAALRVPTIAVFGPTEPAIWAPLGPKVSVVSPRGSASWPGAEDVLIAARTLIVGQALGTSE